MTPLLAFIKPGWTFPVILHFWGWPVPIHRVMDIVAYACGFQLYLLLRRRLARPQLTSEQNAWILVGCIFGALIGAKILAWAEAPAVYWALRHSPEFWFGGKTIVGGLLGGWIGVEIVKKTLHITSSAGDLCVFPLILGMALGRIGCFLTGLSDDTCGLPTSLPWGVDFGDGVPRHPVQLYDIFFLTSLGCVLWINRSALTANGHLFRWFMGAYLLYRFLIEFIKPHWTLIGGLTAIQWACLAGVLFCTYSLTQLARSTQPEESHV